MMKKNILPIEQQLILAHILQKSRGYVLSHPEIKLTGAQRKKFQEYVSRRQKHEPLAYILGHKEFYGLDFEVDRNTLIPRPETEHLVEEVIKLDPKDTGIIDIGTGSGNIIITLAKRSGERNDFLAADISEKALRVARRNTRRHGVTRKIKFFRSDLLTNKKLLSQIQNKKLIIIANLPYLSKKIYGSTSPDVKKFEPKSALLSGTDGLDHYKKLFLQINKFLLINSHPSITIILEISPEQKIRLPKLAKELFPESELDFQKDLAGKWRVAIISI